MRAIDRAIKRASAQFKGAIGCSSKGATERSNARSNDSHFDHFEIQKSSDTFISALDLSPNWKLLIHSPASEPCKWYCFRILRRPSQKLETCLTDKNGTYTQNESPRLKLFLPHNLCLGDDTETSRFLTVRICSFP